MKRLILLALSLLVFAGGLAGAWFALDLGVMLGLEDPPPAPEQAFEPAPELTYVTLEPMRVPIFRGDRVHRQADMVIALGVGSEEAEALIEAQRSRLHDLVLRELITYVNLQFEENNAMNVTNIRERVKIVVNDYLGEVAFGEEYRAQEVVEHVTMPQLFLDR